MGRPSIKAQRTEQILDAFEWCVARYGVEGSTLEKIAEQAGLARALIRHNIGNRELLLEKLVQRVIKKSDDYMDELTQNLPKHDSINHLINYLFDAQTSDPQLVMVFSSLIIAAHGREKMGRQLKLWTENFIQKIHNQLVSQYPNHTDTLLICIATGITGIYFNVDSLEPLGEISQIRKNSKQAAFLLINLLET